MGHSAERAIFDLARAASATCCVGRLAGISPEGRPIVDFDGNPGAPVVARTACDDFWRDGGVPEGSALVLQFERGDPVLPIVVGRLREPPDPRVARVDDQVLRLQAGRRIELSCGQASIVLTADGKVVIKGAHLVSRSSGPNKIRGATVAIN